MALSIAKVANWLHQVDKARAVVGWWPSQFATDDERLAYKVQDAFLKKQVVKQGPLVGYKIALTSLDRLTGLDAIILAVAHKEYISNLDAIFARVRDGGVVIDVKSAIMIKPPRGIRLWSL